MIGIVLGHYRILSKVGEGGMGEVYRARDTKLNRDVAIKILPDVFAHDAERVARFTREAQTLAALNHPNIAQIYGIVEEQTGGGAHVHALAMELVEGDDLSTLIARGPIPVPDALAMAKQIADALEAAHEQGIVHRDLKPANIKVRPDGTVKVLDFGLAKAMELGADPQTSGGGATAMNSPTVMSPAMTNVGVILGTAAYMAPEQARGKTVDRRADVWAFGVVLYEMLTGHRAFAGDDVSDVLASVLKTNPDLSIIPCDVSPGVRRLLRRCLEKDPRKRLSAIGDARIELDESEDPAAPAPAPRRPSLMSRLWPAAAGVVLTMAAAALLWPRAVQHPTAPLARVSVLPPLGVNLYPDSAQVAISPDGKLIAFVAGDITASELWVRPIDSPTARQVANSKGAALPFWSPDGHRLGFFTLNKLKVYSLADDRVDTLCDAPNGRGATWGSSDVILFAPEATGRVYRVSPNGGDPAPVTALDESRGESGHRFPVFLPDGDHFLFAALPSRNGKFEIYVASLHEASRTLVATLESAPVYADPGWLLYIRQGVVAAQPFDVKTLTVTGEAQSLGDRPTTIVNPGTSFTASHPVSVSATGTFVYFSAPFANTQALRLDTAGRSVGSLTLPQGQYLDLAIAPDGSRAVMVRADSSTQSSLWLVDLTRGGASRLSTGTGQNVSPVWSPDGTRIVFTSDRDGPSQFYAKAVADAASEAPFFTSPVLFKNPSSWSPDGKWIVFVQLNPETAQDMYLMAGTGQGEAAPFVRGPSRDLGGPVSPDGKQIAYVAEDSGRAELYLESFPKPGRKVQVSVDGANRCWWSKDGRQLIYQGLDMRSLWKVGVDNSGAHARIGQPARIGTLPADVAALDMMPDRQSFIALVPEHTATGAAMLVQNWQEAIRKK